MKTNTVRYPWIRAALIFGIAVALNCLIISDTSAQRGRGGGGGARGGGGGGASFNRSPSMSRPSTPSMSRPSPGGGGNFAANRGGGGGAAARPQPSGGGAGRLQAGGGNAARPQAGGQRPSTGFGQGGRPSQSDLSNFLNLPGQGGYSGQAGLANRASGAASRPAGANAAVADFFQSGAKPQSFSGGDLASNRSDNIANRTDARSDFRGSRGENRDFASDNRQDRVSDRGDRQAARIDNRGEMRSSLADGRADNRSERQQQLGDQADHIRDELENEFDENHIFDDFWKNNPQAYVNFHQNPVLWTWAAAATVSAFIPGYPASPTYYDYGSGGNVYYEGDTVYTGDTTVPAEEYAQQAADIAASAPPVENPDDLEWLPLGVFVLSQDGATAAPNMFLQMAVSKEGIIAGTFQNKTTGETQSIEGMVDQKSQRAAWTIKGKSTPIMETGLANLTQNETRALLHFADGTTQQWLMAHLEKPKDIAQPQN